MKNEACPNCGGMLGVPDKLRGRPVECPVCQLEFVPGSRARGPKKQAATKTGKSSKPTIRAVPLPSTISAQTDPAPNETASLDSRDKTDHLMPPKTPRLSSLAPEQVLAKQKLEVVEPTVRPGRQADADTSPTANNPESDSAIPAATASVGKTSTVARIIKTESVQPQLTKDGKLPMLQLVDAEKPKVKDSELKSNPVFVGLLICFSLVTSGVMLFVVGMQPSETAKKVLQSRQEIRGFYEVRVDQEVAPFQLELREAQLANSRGDFRAEIRFYEKVMARFHAEDRNQFKGLTGSPTGDVELEKHVSVLLNEAKRRVRRGR